MGSVIGHSLLPRFTPDRQTEPEKRTREEGPPPHNRQKSPDMQAVAQKRTLEESALQDEPLRKRQKTAASPQKRARIKKWQKDLPSEEERHTLKNVEQNTEVWMDARLGIERDPTTGEVIAYRGAREGASSTAILCGWSKYELPYDKWRLYTGQVTKENDIDTFFTDHGHTYEDEAKELYIETITAELEGKGHVYVEDRGIYVDSQHANLAASPDFVAYFDMIDSVAGKSMFSGDRFYGLGEIKCPIFCAARARHDSRVPHTVPVAHALQMLVQICTMRDQIKYELHPDVLRKLVANGDPDGPFWCDYISHWRENERKQRNDGMHSETLISRVYYNPRMAEQITELRLRFINHCITRTQPEGEWWYHPVFNNEKITIQPMYHLRNGKIIAKYLHCSPLQLTLEELWKR